MAHKNRSNLWFWVYPGASHQFRRYHQRLKPPQLAPFNLRTSTQILTLSHLPLLQLPLEILSMRFTKDNPGRGHYWREKNTLVMQGPGGSLQQPEGLLREHSHRPSASPQNTVQIQCSVPLEPTWSLRFEY